MSNCIREAIVDHDCVYYRLSDGHAVRCSPLPEGDWRPDGSHLDVELHEIDQGYLSRIGEPWPDETPHWVEAPDQDPGTTSGWVHTHTIYPDGQEPVPVYLMDGVAYARDEWEACEHSDYEVVDGGWLFQGATFAGRVEAAS